MKDLPSGCPDVPALTKDSVFEYTLGKEHADNRVWIRVTSPDGETAADIGLLVNDEGISIDVWATDSDGGGHPDDGPIIAPWLLWSDIGEG